MVEKNKVSIIRLNEKEIDNVLKGVYTDELLEHEYIFDYADLEIILTPPRIIKAYCVQTKSVYTGIFHIPYYWLKNSDTRIGFMLMSNTFFMENVIGRWVSLNLIGEVVKNFNSSLAIYQSLPSLILSIKETFNINIDEEIIDTIKYIYIDSAKWLEAWHEKQNTKYLKNSSIGWLEKFARVRELRYRMINELQSCNRIKDIIPNHNVSWLLCEFSVFLNILENNYDNVNALYTDGKKHLDFLDDIAPCEHELHITDLLRNFHLYIDMEAKQYANFSDEFNELFYTPYIKACRSWNAAPKKLKLSLVPVNKPASSKPGTKIGHKNNPRKS